MISFLTLWLNVTFRYNTHSSVWQAFLPCSSMWLSDTIPNDLCRSFSTLWLYDTISNLLCDKLSYVRTLRYSTRGVKILYPMISVEASLPCDSMILYSTFCVTSCPMLELLRYSTWGVKILYPMISVYTSLPCDSKMLDPTFCVTSCPMLELLRYSTWGVKILYPMSSVEASLPCDSKMLDPTFLYSFIKHYTIIILWSLAHNLVIWQTVLCCDSKYGVNILPPCSIKDTIPKWSSLWKLSYLVTLRYSAQWSSLWQAL